MSDDSDKGPAYLSTDGAVATLTLNRPAVSNALDLELAERLATLALSVEKRDDIRVLVIEGKGKNLCAGGDIKSFIDAGSDLEPFIRRLLGNLHAFLRTLRRMPQIVLTSLHGTAAGGGLSFVLMGDLCIAAEDARLAPAYRNLGVTPDGGGSGGLVRAVGIRRALQFFLVDDSVSARQAETWGIVNWVVPAATLKEETALLAARLAKSPSHTLAATKRLIRSASTNGMDAQLEDELESMLACMRSPFFSSSTQKFLAARPK